MKLFIFPFLIDLITFLVMLRLADAAGREMHLSNLQTSWFMVSYSSIFLVACLVVSRRLNRSNARPLLIGSISLVMALGVPLFFTQTFWPTLLLFAAFGAAVATAFNSLQTFMRGEAPAGSLGLTLARYTISWSLGIAYGFLLGGILKDVGGSVALGGFTVLACLSILLLVLTHDPRAEEHASADATIEEADPVRYPTAPPVDRRYVVVGWALCMGANFSQRPLTTFIPKFQAESGSPVWVAGFLLSTFFVAQAISGYHAYQRRHWLYRKRPLIIIQLLIVLFLALLWRAPNFSVSLLVLVVLGALYGFIYFSCVYYVSNDIHSSRNVGINEAMVGIGNILGMLMSEVGMRLLHSREAYFPVCMAVALLLIAAQWLWLKDSSPTPLQRRLLAIEDSR